MTATEPPHRPRNPSERSTPGSVSRFFRLSATLIVFAALGVGGVLFYTDNLPEEVQWLVARLRLGPEPHPATDPAPVRPAKAADDKPWDGLVGLADDQIAAIGVRVVEAVAQTEPLKLELTGRTAYDEHSLTKIRPRFDTLVEGVLAQKGGRVKKGAPLVELYSTELATAKNQFQINYVQWRHDVRFLDVRSKLAKTGAISEQAYIDTINEESKSRLDYYTSWENLRVLGVPDSEIEPLTANLGEAPASGDLLNVADKAKMTLRSPVDGIVIERDVVPGNLYDNDDVLLVIAPLDQLWVWVNVFERDQAKVALGQQMNIQFPFLERTFSGVVEYVATEVSKESRAVQIRASIPNPDAMLKADMLVRAVLDVAPVAGQTVIPRICMVMIEGEPFVFVRNHEAEEDAIKLFERRRVSIAQENHDTVIIHAGLTAGEEVATNGSLILAQLYQDLQLVATGEPPR